MEIMQINLHIYSCMENNGAYFPGDFRRGGAAEPTVGGPSMWPGQSANRDVNIFIDEDHYFNCFNLKFVNLIKNLY